MDLKEREEKILKYWAENRINEKVRKEREAGKKFYFLDGPPYASGELGVHHVWVHTIKDLVVRYKRYNGLNVHDRAGFDVHGLPIEFKVEKKFNIQSKHDIEARVGVEAFVKACKDYAEEQVKGATITFQRFGSSLDFERVYLPYEDYYINKGWQLFKEMHSKKLLYKGHQPLAYCPRCETFLSAQGPEVEYADETDRSIFVKFKITESKSSHIKFEENTYLVIWTTTPWTLPANIAIAANPKELYVTAVVNNENYVVAKARLDEFAARMDASAIIKKEFYGSELESTHFISPLQTEVPIQKTFAKFHRVILSESFVSVKEGTGLLHVAPGHGPEDYKLGKQYKLPVFSPVDEHARYTSDAGKFSNLYVPKEANDAVMASLKASKSLLFEGSITHSYPHCWRCHSKLIVRAAAQWFINIQKIKGKMLKENEKIIWYPGSAREGFAEAINSSPDWCISRQRYWGAPLPIWICGSCKEMEVIGSEEELRSKAMLKEPIKDLHKPNVDKITLECRKCKGTMHRVPDIFDVWYDSGISHTASLSDEEFARLYPADWITESLDQIRGWFAALLRTSVAVYGKRSYSRVSIGGWMKDELGQQMHRHLGNITSANELVSMVSADGFRLWCSSHPRWLELRLKQGELTEADSNIITLYNVAALVKEFAQISGNDIKTVRKPSMKNLEKEDAWILSKLNTLIERTTQNMDNYLIDVAVRDIRDFILEDLSRFYLKFAKQRAEVATKSQLKRISNITAYVMDKVLLLASIIMPFTCESIYQEMFSKNNESIFMNKWPKPDRKFINRDIESDFEVLKETSNAVLGLREKKGSKLRWPIASVTVASNDDDVIASIERVETLLSMYTNAKSAKIVKGAVSRKSIKPVFSKLGPAFKGDAQAVADELLKSDAGKVTESIDKTGYYIVRTKSGNLNVLPEHFTVVESVQSDSGSSFRHGSSDVRVDIDSELTEELKEEMLTREFIRRVQMMRKEMNLTRLDRVAVYAQIENDIAQILVKNTDQIKSVTRSKEVSINKGIPEGTNMKEWDILGSMAKIAIKK
jgi:isoleucyl-tRNA synthetase